MKLDGKRIVVVCGSGGVGKTTISAALALRLASERERVTILAVDPAKRLATALGLPRTPGERTSVRVDGASLEAQLLDTKRTFDELVERHAGSEERKERILANRFYQRIAETLSGTHEYMAMERLYDLATNEEWDGIVIDTPPTRSALSFLDAPKRMSDFLGGQVLKWLLWPYRRSGRIGLRGVSLGAQAFGKMLGRIAGSELLADLGQFLAEFEGMYDGFKRRAAAVLELLREEQTGFVVVTAPEARSLEEAGHFVDRLGPAGMHLSGVVVNRYRQAPKLRTPDAARERLAGGGTAHHALASMLDVSDRLATLEARETAATRPFADAHPEVPLTFVPQLPIDVHDVPALELVAAHLAP
ncbi:MAG: ArsA family ATPase [Actinomycetota bacterium]|nr:AAA family ATPase [Actinomycetota bacterium]